MNLYLLDGTDMPDKETAYRVIAQTMRFPEWFGNNLDALADCLGEMRRDSVVIFRSTAAVVESMGGYGEKLLACFRELAAQVGFQLIEL